MHLLTRPFKFAAPNKTRLVFKLTHNHGSHLGHTMHLHFTLTLLPLSLDLPCTSTKPSKTSPPCPSTKPPRNQHATTPLKPPSKLPRKHHATTPLSPHPTLKGATTPLKPPSNPKRSHHATVP